MADILQSSLVTPEKNSFSKAVSQAFFSRSTMKKKVKMISRALSLKKKSWKPLTNSYGTDKDQGFVGSYDKRQSPLAQQMSDESGWVNDTSTVANLTMSFDLMADEVDKIVLSATKTSERNDNSAPVDLSETQTRIAESACVVDMRETDIQTTPNPFLPKTPKIKTCSKHIPPIQAQAPGKCNFDTARFQYLDNHAIEIATRNYTDMKQLAADLVKICQNDLDKTRTLFRWVIAMDQKKTQRKHHMSPDIIGSSKESCHKLFAKLCRHAGICCEIVVGYSKGAGYKPGMRIDEQSNRNSWTAVAIEGSWRLVNCTWAARHMTGSTKDLSQLLHKLDEFYFLTDPKDHIFQHFPDDPKWQLLRNPITLEEFEKLPSLKSPFFKHGLAFSEDYPSALTTEDGCVEIKLRLTSFLQLGARLEPLNDTQTPTTNCCLHRIANNEAFFNIRLPASGSYVFSAFAGRPENSGCLECIFSVQISCQSEIQTAPFPPTSFLGPTEDSAHFDIVPRSHPDPLVNIEHNSLSLDFDVSKKNRFTHTLQFYDSSLGSFIDADRYAFAYSRTDSRLNYLLSCPRKGSYIFSLYGADDESSTYECVYQYLLVCPSNDLSRLAYPRTSRGWRDCEIRSPLCGDLVKETSYDFDLTVEGAIEVFVVIGTGKKSLKRSRGDNWKGQVYTGDNSMKATIFASYTADCGNSYTARLLTYELL